MRIISVIAVLAAATVLNNWLARGPVAYMITSLAATAVLLLIARWDGLSRDDLGLGAEGLRRGLRWAPVLAGLALAVLLLLLAVPGGREAFQDARAVHLSVAELMGRVLVRVPFGTVLLEETAFRGVLWAMLRRRYGDGWATAVSSLLFGLWHVLPSRGLTHSNAAAEAAFGSGSAGVAVSVTAAVAATAVAGVFLCELRRRSGSLLAPAALHGAVNGFSYALAWGVARW
ncbi:CPBP family intramembrane glutamic endopeptidase [Streptomyces sp. NPDC002838]|uniref:CPBP family intramembrane glutamic endopeptidase n=1 Tax=Streptomyces sp. NPDC002838 TaxID=3154436 RepID=UPI00332C6FCA